MKRAKWQMGGTSSFLATMARFPFFGHIILKVEGAFGQRGIRLFEKLITNNDSLRMKKKCFWPEFGQNALKAFYQK